MHFPGICFLTPGFSVHISSTCLDILGYKFHAINSHDLQINYAYSVQYNTGLFQFNVVVERCFPAEIWSKHLSTTTSNYILGHNLQTEFKEEQQQSRYGPGVAPEGSWKLRFPDFMTTAQDGSKVVSLTHRPHLPAGNTPGTHFC